MATPEQRQAIVSIWEEGKGIRVWHQQHGILAFETPSKEGLIMKKGELAARSRSTT